jgi:hypothetical protein
MKASSLLLPASLAGLVFAQATSLSVYILPPCTPTLIEVVSSALNTLGYSYIDIEIPGHSNDSSSSSNGIGHASSDQNNIGSRTRTRTRTYTVLASQDYMVYRNILRKEPESKFILPVEFSYDSGSSSVFNSMISYPSFSWLGSLFKQQQPKQHQAAHGWEDQPDTSRNDRLAADDLHAYINSVRAFFTDADTDTGIDADADADADTNTIVNAKSPECNKRSSRLLVLEVLPADSNPYAQTETWVTLCEFLGLGYSTVERLKLWRFPK